MRQLLHIGAHGSRFALVQLSFSGGLRAASMTLELRQAVEQPQRVDRGGVERIAFDTALTSGARASVMLAQAHQVRAQLALRRPQVRLHGHRAAAATHRLRW